VRQRDNWISGFAKLVRYTFRQRSNFRPLDTEIIMAKPLSDDVAFAKHFIDSALRSVDAGDFELVIQCLGISASLFKALRKKADGAA
jgi:hypothetical protein